MAENLRHLRFSYPSTDIRPPFSSPTFSESTPVTNAILSVAGPTLRSIDVIAFLLATLTSEVPTPCYPSLALSAARASPNCTLADSECLGRAMLRLLNEFRHSEGLPALVFLESLFALALESSTANAKDGALSFP